MTTEKQIPAEYAWIKPGVKFRNTPNGFTATVSELPKLIDHPKRSDGVWIVFFKDPSHERAIPSSYCEHITPLEGGGYE